MKQITRSHIDRPFFASRALRHNTKQALRAIKTIQRIFTNRNNLFLNTNNANLHEYGLCHTENTVIAKRFYRSNLFAYMSKASLKKGDSRLKEIAESLRP